MPRRILIVTGSPREGGGSRRIADWVAEGARSAGASVEVVHAAGLDADHPGCTACYRCQATADYRCAVPDAVGAVVNRFREQDALVFATPVYFMGMTAQLKRVVDRMYSQFRFSADGVESGLQRPRLGLIATAGGGEGGGLRLLEQHVRAIADFAGKELRTLLVPYTETELSDAARAHFLRDRALAFGRDLAVN
jgi:multimeric flavodoxin WrbA